MSKDPGELLTRFGAAWERQDPAAVATLLAPDCIYEASVGPEPGRTLAGRETIRTGLEVIFAGEAATRVEIRDHFAVGDRAAWEWRYYDASGSLLARGCDLFTFRDGLIHRKNAFRKTLG